MPTESKLLIEENQDEYIVRLGKNTLFKIKKGDRLSIRVAIISLVNCGLVKKVDLARAFHLHRDTISNYLKLYKSIFDSYGEKKDVY